MCLQNEKELLFYSSNQHGDVLKEGRETQTGHSDVFQLFCFREKWDCKGKCFASPVGVLVAYCNTWKFQTGWIFDFEFNIWLVLKEGICSYSYFNNEKHHSCQHHHQPNESASKPCRWVHITKIPLFSHFTSSSTQNVTMLVHMSWCVHQLLFFQLHVSTVPYLLGFGPSNTYLTPWNVVLLMNSWKLIAGDSSLLFAFSFGSSWFDGTFVLGLELTASISAEMRHVKMHI